MSRSYKLRHLPKLGANKYVEGVSYRFYHETVYASAFPGRFLWYPRKVLVNAPVAAPGSHPWASWWCAKRIKGGRKFFATLAHRKARRALKMVLKKSPEELEGLVFVTSDNFFDTWQFT